MMNGYVAATASALYLVAYVDLPGELSDQEQLNTGYDLERDYMIEELNGRLVSERRLNQGKIRGREVIVERDEAVFIQHMYYKDGRFYAARMVVPRFGYPTSFALKVNRTEIDRFLNSFKIL